MNTNEQEKVDQTHLMYFDKFYCGYRKKLNFLLLHKYFTLIIQKSIRKNKNFSVFKYLKKNNRDRFSVMRQLGHCQILSNKTF